MAAGPLFIIIGTEHVRTVVKFHTEDESDGEHVPHERASAVADEGQGNAGDWQELDRHADVFEYMECNHGDDARTNVCAEWVF